MSKGFALQGLIHLWKQKEVTKLFLVAELAEKCDGANKKIDL